MIRHTKKPLYAYNIIIRNQSVLTLALYSINKVPTAVGGRDAAYHKGLYRELRPLCLACPLARVEQLEYLCLLSRYLFLMTRFKIG
jgi:hypothetical protein